MPEPGTEPVALQLIQEMRSLNADYLQSGKGNENVSQFLEKAIQDEDILLRFLIGRKLNAKHAWETLKRYAQVRFDLYPELYPTVFSEKIRSLVESDIVGLLKTRDKLGRRINLFDLGAWDTDKYSADEVMIMSVKQADYNSFGNDGTGTVFIIQCSGFGVKQLKECTITNIRRCFDVFLRAYPVRTQGIYFVNAPYIFSGIANLIRMLLPGKLKNRLVITSKDCLNCKEIMELVSARDLPQSFGGPLKFQDAVQDLKPLFGF